MFRTGNGIDFHRLTEGRSLILGGVAIPFEKGLLGHSDADVLLHALCDAILGAAALGDIGVHFPDKSPEFKDIDSRVLLRRTARLAERAGFRLGNADITVVCERPKLMPFVTKMRENIAEDLKTDISRISVKATTSEGMGFAGRGEGIAAFASVLLCETDEAK